MNDRTEKPERDNDLLMRDSHRVVNRRPIEINFYLYDEYLSVGRSSCEAQRVKGGVVSGLSAITVERYTNGELHPVPEIRPHVFSDGAPHWNVDPGITVDSKRPLVVTVRSGNIGDLASAVALCHQFLSSHKVWMFCPYVPGARQDKSGQPNIAEASSWLLDENSSVVVDPHSEVCLWNTTHAHTIEAVDLIPESLIGPDVGIIAPDEGAVPRAQAVAHRYNLPLFVAHKKRDQATGRILEYKAPEVTTKRALVVDDICDGGGTFIALAEQLGMSRENLSLWTTHGIYANGLYELRWHYSTVACSDSFDCLAEPDLKVPTKPHLLKILKDIYQ